MSLPPDDPWLRAAERIDAMRIIPRVLCFGYGGLYWVAFFWLIQWVMKYPFDKLEEPAIALAIVGLPASLLTIMGGTVSKMF